MKIIEKCKYMRLGTISLISSALSSSSSAKPITLEAAERAAKQEFEYNPPMRGFIFIIFRIAHLCKKILDFFHKRKKSIDPSQEKK